MKNLGPVNRPGLSELAPLKPTRSRSPSYQKAKLLYDEALDSIHEELDAFRNFENASSEIVSDTDIRIKYRKLKMKQIVLISSSEDLEPLLKRSGQVEEERRMSEEVMAIHEQVTNIKLTYQEVVSNVTNSILGDRDMEDIELTSTPETKQYSTNGWNCSTMTEAVQHKPTVQLSNTNTINMISGCIPTVTHHSSVHSPTHYHAISCSSTTCMTDRVVKTFDLIPMQQSLTQTTPVQSLTSATVHHQHIQPSRETDVLAQ